MIDRIKKLIIGKPLENEALGGEKYGVLWGLPILASDVLSSIAYASEEILIVLVPALGVMAYSKLSIISAAIIGLLFLVSFSYSQTIQEYPSGGGSYVVASDNLGHIAGVTAGASLAVGYTLTVAVSICSGTAAITSAFPSLLPYTVPICIIILVLLMIGNLRGLRESVRIFSFPPYAFIFAILVMIGVGLFKYMSGAPIPELPTRELRPQQASATMLLLFSAFANGCAALTGVEAVSNAVPNFKEPSVKNAKIVLLLLSILVFIMFGGTSLLTNVYHVVPIEGRTVLSQIAQAIFGRNIMFYFIQAATALILSMAANTAYSGFPILVSIMAKDGYVPRQLSIRGERLSFSNGILSLSVLAGILIVAFKGNTSALIPLYAVGVFVSFTLSQTGMFVRWWRVRGKNWHYKAFVNGLGAVVTAIVVGIVSVTKFYLGAWIVIILIPGLIFLMLKVKKHYLAVASQLRIPPEELSKIDLMHDAYSNHVIVPIDNVHRASIRALKYARTISNHVVAFNVSIDEESAEKIKNRYALLHTDIPLIVKYSPYRRIVGPLLEFIESAEYEYKKGDMITVMLPQFSVRKWWHALLHNHSRLFIERELLKHKHIVVATMPLQLKNDDEVVKQVKK